MQHYGEGCGEEEKYLSSKHEDPTKRKHNIIFKLSENAADNSGAVIRCVNCKTTRLIYSQY